MGDPVDGHPYPMGAAEGEDVGKVPGAPEVLREEDVSEADALDDRVVEEDLPGDDAAA